MQHYSQTVSATRRLLARRGLTVSEAARRAGIPRSSLDRCLNRRGSMPHRYWWKLWAMLGVAEAMASAISRHLDAL